MKDKYLVKESNGLWYEGKYYLDGAVIELVKSEYEGLKNQVKLEPVKAEQKVN